MRTHLIYTILGFVCFCLAVQKVEAGKLKIVTTLPSLASITEYIGGSEVSVESITRGSQDAHYVEAKPSYMIKLNRADLLIYSGLELEIGWLPLLIQGARNEKVTVGSPGNLNASLALPPESILEKPRGEVDRSMGDVHPAGNPHYLLNPNNAIPVAELIAERLIKLDPEHKQAFEDNLDTFRQRMEDIISELENRAAGFRGRNVVCYHVHWSYLIDWLQLRLVGYIELRPGIPPTPQHKKEIIRIMKEKQVKVVIVSSWKDPKKAREVAGAAGAKLVILPGEVLAVDEADDYVGWIAYMVTRLEDTFSDQESTTRPHRHIRYHERKRGER